MDYKKKYIKYKMKYLSYLSNLSKMNLDKFQTYLKKLKKLKIFKISKNRFDSLIKKYTEFKDRFNNQFNKQFNENEIYDYLIKNKSKIKESKIVGVLGEEGKEGTVSATNFIICSTGDEYDRAMLQLPDTDIKKILEKVEELSKKGLSSGGGISPSNYMNEHAENLLEKLMVLFLLGGIVLNIVPITGAIVGAATAVGAATVAAASGAATAAAASGAATVGAFLTGPPTVGGLLFSSMAMSAGIGAANTYLYTVHLKE